MQLETKLLPSLTTQERSEMEMSNIERQVLQQNHIDLLRNLKVDSEVLGILYEKGILTEHMVQIVQVNI